MQPHLLTAGEKWKNQIRVTLSIKECFRKCGPAPLGRGFYWHIHPGCIDMFRCGDFDPIKIHYNIRTNEHYSKIALSNSPLMRPDNQNTADQGTTIPVDQNNMTAEHQNYMNPINQDTMTAVNQYTLTSIAQNNIASVSQTAVTPFDQATTIVAPYSSVAMTDNQSSSPPGNHNQLHGYQLQYSATAIAGSVGSQYSQYCLNMENYHKDIQNYNWMPTSSHFNYSLCSYL